MHNAECWSSMPICIRLMTMCLVFAVRDIVECHSIGCEQRFETRLCTPQMYNCPHVTKDTPLKITFNCGPSHFCVIFHVVEKACIKHRHLGHGPTPLQLFWKLKQSELLKTFHTMYLLFCWWIVIFLYHVAYNDIDNFTNLGCMPYIVLNCRFDDAHKSISWRVFVIKHFNTQNTQNLPEKTAMGWFTSLATSKYSLEDFWWFL